MLSGCRAVLVEGFGRPLAQQVECCGHRACCLLRFHSSDRVHDDLGLSDLVDEQHHSQSSPCHLAPRPRSAYPISSRLSPCCGKSTFPVSWTVPAASQEEGRRPHRQTASDAAPDEQRAGRAMIRWEGLGSLCGRRASCRWWSRCELPVQIQREQSSEAHRAPQKAWAAVLSAVPELSPRCGHLWVRAVAQSGARARAGSVRQRTRKVRCRLTILMAKESLHFN